MAQCNHLGERVETPGGGRLNAGQRHPSSAQLKELIKARRARADFFGAHLFADPAWDILLLLYVGMLDKERVLLATLLRTSLVPATTTLRWVKGLEQDGWIEQSKNAPEGREVTLKLTAAGKTGMERYLSSVWPSLPL